MDVHPTGVSTSTHHTAHAEHSTHHSGWPSACGCGLISASLVRLLDMLGHVECSTGVVLASSAKWSASCVSDISVVPAFQAVAGQIVRHHDPSSCVSRMVGLESVCGSCALRHAVGQVLGSRMQQSPFCTCDSMHACAREEVKNHHPSRLRGPNSLPCACAWHMLKGPGSPSSCRSWEGR